MDLLAWEHELKRCWQYPYDWRGRMQADDTDAATRFIYSQTCLNDLIRTANERFPEKGFNWQYAINRWYNFRASKAVERIFCESAGTKAVVDERDRLKDLYIREIPFDIKVTNVLKNFPGGIERAKEDPKALARAFYEQQSRGQRYHLKNRMFVVVHDHSAGEHHKVKAELSFMKPIISNYVDNFAEEELALLEFGQGENALAGVIFVEKY